MKCPQHWSQTSRIESHSLNLTFASCVTLEMSPLFLERRFLYQYTNSSHFPRLLWEWKKNAHRANTGMLGTCLCILQLGLNLPAAREVNTVIISFTWSAHWGSGRVSRMLNRVTCLISRDRNPSPSPCLLHSPVMVKWTSSKWSHNLALRDYLSR